MFKRSVVVIALLGALLLPTTSEEKPGGAVRLRFARCQVGEKVFYGVVQGDAVREISGDLFGAWKITSVRHKLADARILVPTTPSKVFALAGNYRDHIGKDKEPPKIPQPFIKLPSCLQRHEGNIELPGDTTDVHYEAELVIVIRRQAKNVSESEALKYVLGITCGNDVSARKWQKDDVQWWRAKASDTFGPCGPFILSWNDNYKNLEMTLRVNGEVRQRTNTSNMVHDIAQTVSFISKHCTLEPGDLIFTGTPGKTQPLKPGDVVEVEIENVGILRNKVVKASK